MQPEPESFARRLETMARDGYALRSCPPHCPDHADGQHAHLTSPDGYDFLDYLDGTADPFDLTGSSGALTPVFTPLRSPAIHGAAGLEILKTAATGGDSAEPPPPGTYLIES